MTLEKKTLVATKSTRMFNAKAKFDLSRPVASKVLTAMKYMKIEMNSVVVA